MRVFAQPWWLDAVCAQWDVAIARKGDAVTGVWPYPVEARLGVKLLRTPILTPYLGPQVFLPADIKESNADGFEHETVADLITQLPDAPFWHLALQPGISQAGIFKQQGLNTAVQQTFLLDLNATEAQLLANMKDTLRRNLKQAENTISIINDPAYLPELFHFHEHTLNRKQRSLPYGLSDLQRIMDACLANNSAALWVAKEGSETQAIVWQVWDRNCSYYFMGGQNPGAASYKAMSLLLWHAIKTSRAMGINTFDLEGSMDQGVERFFRSFGGRRTLYIILQKNSSLLWRIKTKLTG